MERYLKKVTETSHICSLLDLFTNAESKAVLLRAPMEEIYLNYMPLGGIGARLNVNDLY
jgi:hypothetical protein